MGSRQAPEDICRETARLSKEGPAGHFDMLLPSAASPLGFKLDIAASSQDDSSVASPSSGAALASPTAMLDSPLTLPDCGTAPSAEERRPAALAAVRRTLVVTRVRRVPRRPESGASGERCHRHVECANHRHVECANHITPAASGKDYLAGHDDDPDEEGEPPKAAVPAGVSPEQPERVTAVYNALRSVPWSSRGVRLVEALELTTSPTLSSALDDGIGGWAAPLEPQLAPLQEESNGGGSPSRSLKRPPRRTSSVSYLFDDVEPIVLRVHDLEYLSRIATEVEKLNSAEAGPATKRPRKLELYRCVSVTMTGDTYASARSLHAALCASFACCRAVDAVVRGEFRNAFCVVRPPGHHAGSRGSTCDAAAAAAADGAAASGVDGADGAAASGADGAATNGVGGAAAGEGVADGAADSAVDGAAAASSDASGGRLVGQGFCLINHVAVAARYALTNHADAVRRVAVIDWDLHHGNGTEEILCSADGPLARDRLRESVLFCSIHGATPAGQEPALFPGTAQTSSSNDRRPGEPFNVALPRGTGPAEFLERFKDVVAAAEAFRPDLVIISCGFDAHKDDLFRFFKLNDRTFKVMTEMVLDLAHRCCDDRLVSVLEGGYSIPTLVRCATVHTKSLATYGQPGPVTFQANRAASPVPSDAAAESPNGKPVRTRKPRTFE